MPPNISDRGGRITLAVEGQGGEIVVSVKDSGVGIPPDMLPKKFEMFTQVDRSLERPQGGLGIGLTLVKRLVEMHGAAVAARSEGHARGSEFLVRSQMACASFVPQANEVKDEAAGNTSLRILIVDDNRDSADGLAMMLRMLGNDIHTAYDGAEAVAAAGEFRPDVILLDIGLLKLNGYEACRRI
jgi:Histidine kinase-, DNA gyrase B-, and HSP90-like ATPase/Response regulator receiver domain